MLDLIKYYSNQKTYRKLIVNTQRDIVDANKIKTVAVVFDTEENLQETIIDVQNSLGILKHDITPLIFKKKLKEEEKSPEYFTKKDFSKKGEVISENLISFIKKDFDLLINYSKKSNLYLNLLTLFSKAKFKIGYAKIDDRLYDLMVKEPSFNVRVFHQEIYKYLSILNKL